MDSNKLLVVILGLISLYLIRNYTNKYMVILIAATSLAGVCITKDPLFAVSIGFISGSLYSLFLNTTPESFTEYKIRKEKSLNLE